VVDRRANNAVSNGRGYRQQQVPWKLRRAGRSEDHMTPLKSAICACLSAQNRILMYPAADRVRLSRLIQIKAVGAAHYRKLPYSIVYATKAGFDMPV
jgi:hypothetical protein